LSLFSGPGAAASALNAAWYSREGRDSLAALSLLSAVPGAGQASTVGKWGARLAKIMPMAAKAKKSTALVPSQVISKGGRMPGATTKKIEAAAKYATGVAQDLQKVMGLKSLKGSTYWRTVGKVFDDPDSKMTLSDGAREQIDIATGDPSDPRTQRMLTVLASQAQAGYPLNRKLENTLSFVDHDMIKKLAPSLLTPAEAARFGSAEDAELSRLIRDRGTKGDAPDASDEAPAPKRRETAAEPDEVIDAEYKEKKKIDISWSDLIKMVNDGDGTANKEEMAVELGGKIVKGLLGAGT
jgi:hypothetical protein